MITNPPGSWIAPDVNPGRIAPDCVIHPGCRLSGAQLSIGPGCVLGAEGPLTLRDCQLGSRVQLGGGYFERVTLLDGVSGGNDAHVRPGCLFEESVSFGHAAGFKQTILMPFVTTGSLINFCDCLMAGGTSRRNHSEVGSSFVHFNYSPYHDKATASLIGDVPRGVLLDQDPIFLGGQGGMVGPLRVAYGTVLAAGQISRRDVLEPGRLILHPGGPAVDRPFRRDQRGNYDRLVEASLRYIGNLLALDQWYRHVRSPRMTGVPWRAACCEGALLRLGEALDERLKRLDELCAAAAEQARAPGPGAFSATRVARQWPEARRQLEARIAGRAQSSAPDCTAEVPINTDAPFIGVVQGLPGALKSRLTAWLQTWVDDTVAL